MKTATTKSVFKFIRHGMCQPLLALGVLFLSTTATAVTQIQGHDLLSGQKLGLAARAKGLVVVFLSARCPCSDSHIGIVKKLSQEFGDFQFVGVHSNADETKEESIRYFKQQALPFNVIQDENFKWANELKASKTPHVYVFNPLGDLIYKGGVTSSAHGPTAEKLYLKDALIAAQAGQKPAISESRTLGCSITRGDKYVW